MSAALLLAVTGVFVGLTFEDRGRRRIGSPILYASLAVLVCVALGVAFA